MNYLGNYSVGGSTTASVEVAVADTLGILKKRKIAKGLLKGGTIEDHDKGETANEDAVSLVLTERSMRVVDRVSGDTYFKTLLTDVSFIASGR